MSDQSRSRILLFLTAALILATDQLTKYWVVSQLAPNTSLTLEPWLAPIFSVSYVTNSGAAFGLFQDSGTVFMLIALAVIAGIVYYALRLPARQVAAHAILGMMLGGALGNLIDRFHYGHVVDFVDLNFWPLVTWPVFNVADTSIVLGVALLALLSLREERRAGGHPAEPPAEPQAEPQAEGVP
jgi:signal peptidase II